MVAMVQGTFVAQLSISKPYAVSSNRLRKRHTKQEGGLVDVMMLIAGGCQQKDYVLRR